MPTEPGAVTETIDENGCHDFGGGLRLNVAPDDAPAGHVRALFGMPLRLEATATRDLESVEGVLHATLQERGVEACQIALESLRPVWIALHDQVRDTLERQDRVRTAAVALDETRTQVLESFNLAMLNQMRECEAMQPGTGTDDAGTDAGGMDSGTGDSTTAGPEPCTKDGDCSDVSNPYCDPALGVCVACDRAPDDTTADAACAALDQHVPLCENGDCVACSSENTTACDEQLLICDKSAMTCIPCTEHYECESGACDLMANEPTCFEPENVFDVGEEQPYPTIAAALAAAESMILDRAVLRLHGQGSVIHFDEPATIVSGSVAFIAANGNSPRWSRTGNMARPILEVTGPNTRVYLNGVHLSGSESTTSPGFLCDRAAVDIRRSHIVANENGSIRATNNCNLSIQTSFIGGDVDGVDSISIEDTAFTMLYSTVGAGSGTARPLQCNMMSTVYIRNSIMVSHDGKEIDCSGAVLDSNATNSLRFGTNTMVGKWDQKWFQGYSSGNFLLQSVSGGGMDGATVFAGIATWQTGDPTTDIQGDPRPNSDGTPDYPGADLVP